MRCPNLYIFYQTPIVVIEVIEILTVLASIDLQCIRSENNVLVYLATVVIRAAIKLAAEPGTTEGGSLLRVR
jgi:hypothetical protein